MKKSILLALLLLLPAVCFAQESLTISTYYPSPYGVYSELRISPNDNAHACSSANDEGTMYYDLSEHKMKICDFQSGSYDWRDLGGGTLVTAVGYIQKSSGSVTAVKGVDGDFVKVPKGTYGPGNLLWGIKCNAANGWVRTGCSLTTDGSTADIASFDSDLQSGADAEACLSDNEESAANGTIYITCAKIN